MDAIEQFVQAIKEPERNTITTYSAVVSRKDPDGKIWVKLSGAEDETPTASTSADVKRGDSVMVEWRNNKLYIAGNSSNPSVGVEQADQIRNLAYEATENALVARAAADTAEASAKEAQANAAVAKRTTDEINAYAQTAGKTVTQILNDGETAGVAAQEAKADAASAKASATTAQTAADSALVNLSTVQDVVGVLNWITAHGTMTLTSDVTVNPAHVYFIVDAGGDYVVGGTHYSIVSEPKDAELSTYYELTVDESVQNYVATHIVVDTEGLWIVPDAGGNKVLIAVGGTGHTYSTAGTYIIGKVNNVDTVFAKFTADGATIGEITNGNTRTDIGTSGMQIVQRVSGSDTEIANLGYGSGKNSSGTTSNAPYYTIGTRISGSTIGNYSTVEGNNNIASGFASHAEGYDDNGSSPTTASGHGSHAEGGGTIASGQFSHAEGKHGYTLNTIASGIASHAEGVGSSASGTASHAQNYCTKASSYAQTAIGKANVEDTADTYALIIGNGTDGATPGTVNRSNALTVDWNGNVDIASGAKYKINGTPLAASDVGAVPTTRTVNSNPLSSDITLTASDVGAEPTLTNISESGGAYSGGIEDEKLLTTATITKWQTILGI